MKAATASRPAADNSHLSQALAASTAAAKLASFCKTTGCDPLDLSADGKSLDLLRVLDAMRKRGYDVGTPVKPQAQQVRGHTTWLVTIAVAGVRAVLAVPIPIPLEQP